MKGNGIARAGLALFATTLAIMPGNAIAGGPPAALHGKSVTLHWSELRTGKFTDGSAFHRNVQVDFAFFISSKGRIFRRMSRTMVNDRGSETSSTGSSGGPGTTIRATKNAYSSQLQFAGHTAQSVVQYESGARRLTITFDDGFGNCTIELIHGKEEGAPGQVLHSGGSGRLYLLTAVDVSATRCSIQTGNVFESGT